MTAFEFANIVISKLNTTVFSFTTAPGGKGKVTVPNGTDLSEVDAPGISFTQRARWVDIHFSV